jgi:hypothetical protein
VKIWRVAVLLIWSTLPARAGSLLECQSVEYQLAIAREARNKGAAAPVAEALATADLLPARATPGEVAAPTEVASHRQWLEQKGDELYVKAMAALDAGDRKTAVKSYLVAVKCATTVMARDDRGLRDLALGALRQMADKHPEKPGLRFQVGYYSWLFGDLPASRAAFDRYEAEEKDPYRRWRGQVWRERVIAEHQRALADERAAAATAKARAVAEPSAHSADLPNAGAVDATTDARDDVRKQIAAIDARIGELQSKTKGEVITKNGELKIRTYNQKEVRTQLEQLEAKKAELEGQL